MSSFFAKVSTGYLIGSNQRLNTSRLSNEGLLIRFLVHGKSIVSFFG